MLGTLGSSSPPGPVGRVRVLALEIKVYVFRHTQVAECLKVCRSQFADLGAQAPGESVQANGHCTSVSVGGSNLPRKWRRLSCVTRGASRARAQQRPALAAGSTPDGLAECAGVSTAGIRNPYAVLAARLSPAELPPRAALRAARSPWCGTCDERTRMLGFDGDAPRPARAANGGQI